MGKLDDLLAVCEANPDDVSARLVLADAWMEAGDRRGELIQVQNAIASGHGGADLLSREAELVRLERAALIGDRADIELRFRLGFLETVVLSSESDAAAVKALLAHPRASLAREIELEVPEASESDGALPRLFRRFAGLTPARYRRLRIGRAFASSARDRWFSIDTFASQNPLDGAFEAFPATRELVIDLGAGALTVRPLRSDALESFEWIAPYIERPWLEGLVSSHLPNLRRFVLWTGGMWASRGDELELEDALDLGTLRHVLGMLDRTSVTEVGLCHWRGSPVADLIRETARRPFFARLRALDLSHCEIHGPDARVILHALSRAPELRTLIARGATLSEDARAALEERLAVVHEPARGSFRYVVER